MANEATIKQEHDAREAGHAEISADVVRVRDHLRANRTTEREAADLRDAAVRSITDHHLAKRIPQ